MKKKLKKINRLSERKQEKFDKSITKETIRREVLVYMFSCSHFSKSLTEFYGYIKQNPRFDLYTHNGEVQGITFKGKTYLFKRNIPKRYKELEQLERWKELGTGSERSEEITR